MLGGRDCGLTPDLQGQALSSLRKALDREYRVYTSAPVRGPCSAGAPPMELAVVLIAPGSDGELLADISATALGRATVIHLVPSQPVVEASRLPSRPALHQGRGNGSRGLVQPCAPRGPLTPLEREVIGLLLRGHSMTVVARLLGITPRTAAYHKYKAMETHGIRSNAELLVFAMRHRLVARTTGIGRASEAGCAG